MLKGILLAGGCALTFSFLLYGFISLSRFLFPENEVWPLLILIGAWGGFIGGVYLWAKKE